MKSISIRWAHLLFWPNNIKTVHRTARHARCLDLGCQACWSSAIVPLSASLQKKKKHSSRLRSLGTGTQILRGTQFSIFVSEAIALCSTVETMAENWIQQSRQTLSNKASNASGLCNPRTQCSTQKPLLWFYTFRLNSNRSLTEFIAVGLKWNLFYHQII